MGLNTQDILIKSYLELIKKLDSDSKRMLIAELSHALPIQSSRDSLADLFGAWEATDVAEDIIATIKNSRQFKRTAEEL